MTDFSFGDGGGDRRGRDRFASIDQPDCGWVGFGGRQNALRLVVESVLSINILSRVSCGFIGRDEQISQCRSQKAVQELRHKCYEAFKARREVFKDGSSRIKHTRAEISRV